MVYCASCSACGDVCMRTWAAQSVVRQEACTQSNTAELTRRCISNRKWMNMTSRWCLSHMNECANKYSRSVAARHSQFTLAWDWATDFCRSVPILLCVDASFSRDQSRRSRCVLDLSLADLTAHRQRRTTTVRRAVRLPLSPGTC